MTHTGQYKRGQQRDYKDEYNFPLLWSIIEREQPVTLYLCGNIAMRKPRKCEGVIMERKTRPASTVSEITHAIASLNFCRTNQANLLLLMCRILYFGSSAPVELMNYNSRIGNMPAPATICQALVSLSEAEAQATAAHGQDPETARFLLVDNCQNYHRQRDLRIGCKNVVNVGMSGLYMEALDIDPNIFNLADKWKLIAQNRRGGITVNDLLGFLDQEDADLTGTLHILDALVWCIPSLKPLSKEISMYLSATSTILVPDGQATVYPLASNGRKETIPTELKAGMLNLLEQIGQKPDAYLKRRLPVGAMLLQLQTYLQFHDDAFKSFEIMEPQLQVWHTKWTDVIRIFQMHWGRVAGKNTNPASLGYSTTRIGRPAPRNMKKVEFYPGTQLLYLVLDAKLLDIWQLAFSADLFVYLAFKTDNIFDYFEGLEKAKKLPDIEMLLPMACKLYCTYGTARGHDHAMHDTGTTSEWAQTVPMEIENSSLDTKKRKSSKKAADSVTQKTTKKTRKLKTKPILKPCKGNFVLVQGVDFICDGLNSRKITTAVARGDIHRMYECIKYMLFMFGGSTHTNYLSYVLETVMNLKLECSPEFFNRLLEDVVEHKSAQFDDIFIRDIISWNLRHIAELKIAWRTGTGMKKKSHKHEEPDTNPELCILLKAYKETEVHSRRLTRQIDDRDTDDFARGVKKVFRTDTVKAAAQEIPDNSEGSSTSDEADSDSSLDLSSESGESDSADNTNGDKFYATQGSSYLIDGELFFDERDMLAGPEDEADKVDLELD
ncbi:hypothetical protein C8R44DRAFT_826975 [Mycena epipterygia]|nr:hypothetical protein C8R44DRAFT_826975 [Mycena epipterygia]